MPNKAPPNGAQSGSPYYQSQSPKFPTLGSGGVGDDQFPTFVPESKFVKIPKSH